MTKKIVAIQMDPLATISIKTDTSFALGLSAQQRGYQIFVYQPQALTYRSPSVYAAGEFVELIDNPNGFYKVQKQQTLDLALADFVLIRQDPPFNLAYITTTHLLELLPATTRVLNNPTGIRNCPEKLAALNFPDLTPATIISKSLDEMMAFIEEQNEVVIKPLYDYGGRGVFKFHKDDGNITSLIELYQQNQEPFIVQQYLPEVVDGDKRIILIDGEGACLFKRVPKHGHTRSNIRIGGAAVKCDFTNRDREICARLKPYLKNNGIMLAGIDVIGAYLTEINVTSPTGLRLMNHMYNVDLGGIFWDKVLGKS